LLNIFGGKITTYRKLAEAALAKIAPRLRNTHGPWTAAVSLPGGEFAPDGVKALIERLQQAFPFLDHAWAQRLTRAYGTEAFDLLGEAKGTADLGRDFGHSVTAAELDWVVANEWVTTGEDFLWRRTRLGLVMSAAEAEAVDSYVRQKA